MEKLTNVTNAEQVWCGLAAEDYDAAVYSNPMLLALLDAELATARALLRRNRILVEVGCGTGQFCRRLTDDALAVIGVDISTAMTDELARRSAHDLLLIHGDARYLSTLLAEHGTFLWLDEEGSGPLVTCVMNTLGIMPSGTRWDVLHQMGLTAGPHGRVFLAVFNGDHFERGIEELYRPNPGLCGPLDDATIDLVTRELTVHSTGYYSHWFSEAELRRLAFDTGLRNVTVTESGIGLLLVADGR